MKREKEQRSPHRLVHFGMAPCGQSYGQEFDMAQVKGQESVKRTLEIAAPGGHNALMLCTITLQPKSDPKYG
jgi:hypothetical protein